MMKRDIEQHFAQTGRALIKLFFLGTVLLATSVTHAASITGSMGLTGAFVASGGTDLSDATILDLTNGSATSADGDIGSTVAFADPAAINNSPFSINPFVAVSNLLTIGGWQVDIDTLTIVDQTINELNLAGTGAISGNGFDLTPTSWTLSANTTGSSYSMTINAVPIPAAVYIKCRNYRYLKAEIDIIAQKGNTIAIIEVKSRRSAYSENIAETVSKKKIGLLVTAADYYINSNKFEREVRFDIITILKKNDRYIIEHLEDAFYHF